MKRNMGSTPIPPCMIGTWAWGSGMNGARMIFGKKYDDQQLIDTFNTAYELGFTLWDTAEVYGMGSAERLLGRCIKDREDVLVSTIHMPNITYKPGLLEKSLSASCERLGIYAPDIYWIHLPRGVSANVKAAAELLEAGKIKMLGVSNFSLEEIILTDTILRKAGFRLAAVQNHFSLLSMNNQQEIIEWCQNNDVIYFAYMVLEQGALSGNYDDKHGFPLISLRNFAFGRGKFRKIAPLLSYEKELAEKYKTHSSQIPIIWAIAKGAVPIVGLTKPVYAKELAEAMNITLTEDEIAKLEKLALATKVTIKGSWEP